MPNEPLSNKDGAQAAESADDRHRRAEEAFERGVIERGEAAAADEEGNLPPTATHEIVGYGKNGKPILRRRRFSAF